MRDFIAKLLRKSGFELHRAGPFPVGRSPFRDMAYSLGNPKCPCIFDVGANIGQTLEEILRFWKDARVHSFEPTPSAFAELRRRAEGHHNVKINQWALGSVADERTFNEFELSTMSSFLASGQDYTAQPVSSYQMRIDTIDDYCDRESIDHVDMLKIDTQGFDLEVLKGAARMMDQGRIAMILLEINFAEYYVGQASAGHLIDHLTTHNYLPMCFYPMMYVDGRGFWSDGMFLHRSLSLPG